MQTIKRKNVKIKDIITILNDGGLVVYPTETLYGIGVDATNEKAILKLNNYKKRPLGKPYSIAVDSQKMAEEYVLINKTAKDLYKKFLPGPVTIVSKGLHKVAPGVESELGTLGVRIPDYQLILDIVRKFAKPITATSANASYKKRPYKITDILENISDKQKNLIDLIIDVGTLPTREPSTVIDTTLDDPVILRQGDFKLKDKNELLSRSPENTKNIAKELWQKYESFSGKRAIVFALEGEMGAGKTIFTKGLAKAMGIEEEVVSPTYSLVEEYKTKMLLSNKAIEQLSHIDAWRMISKDELLGIGFEKMINEKSIIAIEWADRVADIIREFEEHAVVIWVKIKYSKKVSERLISWGAI